MENLIEDWSAFLVEEKGLREDVLFRVKEDGDGMRFFFIYQVQTCVCPLLVFLPEKNKGFVGPVDKVWVWFLPDVPRFESRDRWQDVDSADEDLCRCQMCSCLPTKINGYRFVGVLVI